MVLLGVYVHGMLRYAPEMQQLYFGGCLCPQMKVLWVYFTLGNGRSNEVDLGVEEGPNIFRKIGRERQWPGRMP